MSDKYEWLAMDDDGDPEYAYGYNDKPDWDGGSHFDILGWDEQIEEHPHWLLPGQLYRRGSDIDETNKDCVYQFDGSLWTLVEDYSGAENTSDSDAEITSDSVDHPTHYTSHPSGIECIQVTRHMGFLDGNAMKYLWRYKDKGRPLEDLKKCRFYIDKLIEGLEDEKN